MLIWTRLVRFVPLLLGMALVACSGSERDPHVELKRAAMDTYADIVFANYQDSYNAALSLQQAVDVFVANPSEATMQAAREAWLAAREPYGQSEAYRFYGGPIDEEGLEGLINAWPLDEVYIDYVEGAPEGGIINNPKLYPIVDRKLLLSLNEVGAEENVSVGFHAIEFLLWGQDHRATGAGDRPYTDYEIGGTHANQERRGQYLRATTALLVEHLDSLVQAWSPNVEGNYRAEFLAQEPNAAIKKMLTGIGVLAKSELAGERIFTAYDNQNQEDEHSCFSDNSHRDIIVNVIGIRNVYLGEYERTDGTIVRGTGLDEVVAVIAPEVNQEMLALLEQSLNAARAIPVPFDQAIVVPEQRPQVLAAVNTLQDAGDKLTKVAAALEITINTAMPE